MQFDLRPGVRRLFRLAPRNAAATRAEMDEELESLLVERIDALAARGMSLSDARTEALRRLGDDGERARDDLHRSAERRDRRMRFREYFDDFAQDIRYAARGLARRPAFTAVAVLTLAIGIGATTAIFSAVDVLLLRPLPFARPDELMNLTLVAPDMGRLTGNDQMHWSYPKYVAFRDAQSAFESLSVYQSLFFRQTSGDVQFLRGERVGATYLRTLGLRTVRGRDLDPAIDRAFGSAREILISYAFWQDRFNGDPAAVGQTIELYDVPYTIVGVTEAGFKGLTGRSQVFVPVSAQPAPFARAKTHQYNLIGRRKPGVTEAQAAAEAQILGTRINETFAGPTGTAAPVSALAVPLDGIRVAPLVRTALLILFGAVLFVLLIACVNVANLLLGRASGRRREIAVRLAIGADRGRLLRLLLAESTLLAAIGGGAGVAIAWLGARLLSAVNPAEALGPQTDAGLGAVSFTSIGLDWRALAFALTLSLVVALIFGLVPALAVTRTSLGDALRSSVGAGDRGAALSGRRALVVLEVALALILLVGSGLMIRSLSKLLATDYGFDGHNVLTASFTAFPDGSVVDSLPGIWRQVTERLAALPGVTHVGLGQCAPLSPCSTTTMISKDGVAIDQGREPLARLNLVNADWFAVLHVSLRRGRLFDRGDLPNRPTVAVINEAAARAFFPNGSPIGHRFATRGGVLADGAEIVGVVANVRQSPDSVAAPELFVSADQMLVSRLFAFVRTTVDAASLGADVRRALREVSPRYPIDDMQTMDERTGAATAKARFSALLLGLFAATALSLAVIGIYGVMSLAVAARTRELGIRIALGADRRRVQRLVVGEGMALVSLGAALGLVGAVACTRVLRSLLFDLTPTDPLTYVAIIVLLTITAAGASWIPARRASRVDPIEALRTD
ncbi:MAG: ABC transporter permease [bacterium]